MIGVVDALLPQVAADVEPAVAGQHHVQQDEVPRLAASPARGRSAVGGRGHLVALARSRSVSVSTRPGSSSTSRTRFAVRQGEPHACGSASEAGRCRVKARPGPGVDSHADPPAVGLDDALDQAQAEPVAVNLRFEGAPAPVERLEHVRRSRRRRCRGRGRSPSSRTPAAGTRSRCYGDADPAAVGAVLERIADQVLERAAKRGLVAGTAGRPAAASARRPPP